MHGEAFLGRDPKQPDIRQGNERQGNREKAKRSLEVLPDGHCGEAELI